MLCAGAPSWRHGMLVRLRLRFGKHQMHLCRSVASSAPLRFLGIKSLFRRNRPLRLAFIPSQPRALQRRKRGAGAVAGSPGCQDVHPLPAAQAASVPARQVRVTGPSKASAVTPCQRPGARQRPKAVGSKLSPPGVMRSKPQTPRAGRRREGGLADLKTTGSPRCREMSRPVGPPDPRRPARPRTFRWRNAMNDSDAHASRESWRLFADRFIGEQFRSGTFAGPGHYALQAIACSSVELRHRGCLKSGNGCETL